MSSVLYGTHSFSFDKRTYLDKSFTVDYNNVKGIYLKGIVLFLMNGIVSLEAQKILKIIKIKYTYK